MTICYRLDGLYLGSPIVAPCELPDHLLVHPAVDDDTWGLVGSGRLKLNVNAVLR